MPKPNRKRYPQAQRAALIARAVEMMSAGQSATATAKALGMWNSWIWKFVRPLLNNLNIERAPRDTMADRKARQRHEEYKDAHRIIVREWYCPGCGEGYPIKPDRCRHCLATKFDPAMGPATPPTT